MLPDQVSNPGPLTYESGALPIALRGPAMCLVTQMANYNFFGWQQPFETVLSLYRAVTNRRDNEKETGLTRVRITSSPAYPAQSCWEHSWILPYYYFNY